MKSYMRWQFFFAHHLWRESSAETQSLQASVIMKLEAASLQWQAADTAKGVYLTIHTSVQSAGGSKLQVWAEYQRSEVGFNKSIVEKRDEVASEEIWSIIYAFCPAPNNMSSIYKVDI